MIVLPLTNCFNGIWLAYFKRSFETKNEEDKYENKNSNSDKERHDKHREEYKIFFEQV